MCLQFVDVRWSPFVVALTLCCTAQGNNDVNAHRADTVRQVSASDTVSVSSNSGDLRVSLPVTEHTPVGIRVDSATIWLDSTRIGAAALALGIKSPLGRYAPQGNMVAACVQTPTKPSSYVFFEASKFDTARVVEAVITTDMYETDPLAHCKSLDPSAQISNSLGLKLGMLQPEVQRLLGTADTTTTGTNVRDDVYVMVKVAADTPISDRERAVHGLVNTTLEFHNDSLVMIRIHRGAPLPTFRE